MSTIKDVARRAGVAISTVSAVINRSAPTSAEVVARVEQAIAEIGYAPQRAAQSLRSGQSRLVGVILPDVTNPHFSQLARICENACLAAGYMTFVYNTDEDIEHEMRILRMMRMQRVAGLIHISTRSDAEHGARLAKEIFVPTVLMGSAVEGTAYDLVSLDDVAAGRMAALRLLDLGRKAIAVLGGREGVSSHDDRLRGCVQAFAERGRRLAGSDLVLGEFSAGRAYVHTLRLLSQATPPDAIISFSNLMTIGALRAIRERGVSCPGELSFIGVDDLEWADLMNPRPTLIAQPIAEMTETAVRVLLARIETGGIEAGKRRLFPPRLVLRESCA